MIKRIIGFFYILIICFGMIQIECSAAVPDPAHACSLTLFYTQNGNAFSDLQIDIYRAAELCANGEYALLDPFSNYPIDIHGITSQQEWQDTAQTIRNYVEANQVEAYQSQKTDEEGRVSFAELETGLYMVKGTTVSNNNGTFVFQDFMIYLPAPVENDYDYDVEAKPKYTEYTPPARYTVVKLWKDSDGSDQRPESVCVDILKDGVVQESVILNSTNYWSYSWEVSDKDGVWSVIEKDVPEGYQVSITNYKTTFFITNSKSSKVPFDPDTPKTDTPDSPDKPYPDMPRTGDTSPLLLYVVIMCISGLVLMLLGIYGLRKKK